MTARTGAEREAARKARLAQSGYKRVEVFVPDDKSAEKAVRELAKRLREGAQITGATEEAPVS